MLSVMDPSTAGIVPSRVSDNTAMANGDGDFSTRDCGDSSDANANSDSVDAKAGGSNRDATSPLRDSGVNSGEKSAPTGSDGPSSRDDGPSPGDAEPSDSADVTSVNTDSKLDGRDAEPANSEPQALPAEPPPPPSEPLPIPSKPSDSLASTDKCDSAESAVPDAPPTPVSGSPTSHVTKGSDTSEFLTPEAEVRTADTSRSEETDDIVLRLSESEGGEQDSEAPEDEDVLLKEDDGEDSTRPKAAEPASSIAPESTSGTPSSANEPPTSASEPPTSALEPPTSASEPPASSSEPPASTSEPPASTSEPLTSASEAPAPASDAPFQADAPSASVSISSPSDAPSSAAAADAPAPTITGDVTSQNATSSDMAVPVDGEKSPPNPADPVDLPDDMFESASALKAAAEEEELARKRAQVALSYLEQSEELGEEEGMGGNQGDEYVADSDHQDEFVADVDASRDVDTDTNDVCVEDETMDGQFSSDVVDDSCDGVDGLENAEVEDATELMHEDSTEESMDCVNEGESSDVCEITNATTVCEEATSDSSTLPYLNEVTGDLNSSSGDTKDREKSSPPTKCAETSIEMPSADLKVAEETDDADDPDDPPVSRKRSRSSSPEAVTKQRRVSGDEGPAGLATAAGVKVTPRNFIEVKKVQLSEVNQRLLKESNERERRRLEGACSGSAAAAAAAPSSAPAVVNGAIKSSLRKTVKRLSREELETLVLEKMCESIASRSVIGEMKRSAEKHVTAAERFQKKITHLQKQVGDLHQVVRKLGAELKARRTPAYPVKITRTVGLQVTLAKSVPPLTAAGRGRGLGGSLPSPAPGAPTSAAASAASAAPTPDVSNGVLRSQLTSPPRPGTIRPRVMATVPRGTLLAPSAAILPGRGAPRSQIRPLVTSPQRGQQAALGLPVLRQPGPTGLPIVRTSSLPLGSVPLPQRAAAAPAAAQMQAGAAATGVAHSPSRRGRPPRLQTAPGAGAAAGAAAIVDLTDDDDKRPAPAAQRKPTTTITTVTRSPVRSHPRTSSHPAPFPMTQPNPIVNTAQLLPPPPELKVTRRANGIVLSWTMDLTPRHAAVVSYHLFAYQQSAPAISARNNPWKKVGDVKALPLPMACTLTQFQEGHKYHFAVRAEDSFRRRGPFSNPSSIALMGSS